MYMFLHYSDIIIKNNRMQKLIRKHQWVTKPDSKGVSYFGLTDFAKDYLLRLDSISHEQFFKTRYGISYKYRIGCWLEQLNSKYNLNNDFLANLSKLATSERIQFDRFCIRQGQPFAQLRTVEFDISLSAPLPMRVLQCNFEAEYSANIFNQQWLYKVHVIDTGKLKDLMTEQGYSKTNKVIQYEGMLH